MRLSDCSWGLGHFFPSLLLVAGLAAAPESSFGYHLQCDRLFEDVAPVVHIVLPGAKRSAGGHNLRRLRIAHYSLNMLRLDSGRGTRSGSENITAIAAVIQAEKPDVLTLSEIMNRETLEMLSKRLSGAYQTIMIDGNGDVDTAILLLKSLPLVVEVESHRSQKHEYLGHLVPLFTRDLLTLHLSLPDAKEPLLSIAAVHFKAQKNTFDLDPRFAIKRAAEELGALAILDASARLRSSRARILIGDANGDVRKQSEMSAFKAAGYQEALEVLGIPMERRPTHAYFPRFGMPSFWQTDAAFVSPEIIKRNALVSGYVVADRSRDGRGLKRPRNVEDLRMRLSDHQMILIELDVTKLQSSAHDSAALPEPR